MFTAMTEMASRLRNPWPIHLTTDTTDLSQADRYQDQGQYVWLMHQSIHIREDFPLSWVPEDNEQFNVHAFPYCKLRSKKVIRWDAMLLVPTNPDKRLRTINQNLIAGYDRNQYSIFLVAGDDPAADDKLKAHRSRFPNAYLVKNVETDEDLCKAILGKLFSKYAWLIDIDMAFDDEFELYYDTANSYQTTMFTWNTKSTASELIYPTGGVRLVPYSYIKTLGKSQETDIKIINNVPGKLNNCRNPLQAYESAFRETVGLYTSNFEEEIDLDNIVENRLSDSSHRLHRYIHRGITDAINLMETHKDNKDEFDNLLKRSWVRDYFKSGQQQF